MDGTQWYIIGNRDELLAEFAGIDKDRARELLNEYGEPVIVYDGTPLSTDLENFRYLAKKAGIPREQWSPKAVAERHKEVRENLFDEESDENK